MTGKLGRKGKLLALGAALLWLAACAPAAPRPAVTLAPATPMAGPRPEVTLTAADRILILAPHPDDETIGCGGVIQKAVALGLPLRVVFLTYGDNNEWSFVLYRKRLEVLPGQVQQMGLVRHDEATAAARTLGLTPEQLVFLGYPDFGTLDIWYSHWGDQPPLRSMLTRVTAVPYANARRPGAPYKGEEILADLETILGEFRPTQIFLSHPADHNPDHLALYLFTRVALWDLGLEPALYPYLVHYPRWPTPRGYLPSQPLTPPAGLGDTPAWWNAGLSQEEVLRKEAALRAHRTQYEANPRYLPAFVRTNELFSNYPEVVLWAGAADTALGPEGVDFDQEVSDELTETERAAFVGVEWRTVRRAGDDLTLTLRLSRPLAEGVGASIYLLGYRADQAFATLPKVHVQIGYLDTAVYDQEHELPEAGVVVTRAPTQIELRIPLALLGRPQRLLISARTYVGPVPLDSAAWRVVILPAE